MDIKELKAKAYDCLAQIDYWKAELNKLNAQILEESQKEKSANVG